MERVPEPAEQTGLGAAELQLLEELSELRELADEVTARLNTVERELTGAHDEIAKLRRQATEVQQENQQLREQLQTWRQRLSTVLGQLRDLG